MLLTFLTILALMASVPRTWTVLHLLQLKEWRRDRLLEHLRHFGFISQLFGTIEPVVIALLIGVAWLVPFDAANETLAALCVILGLHACKLLMRRNIAPVWTKKAIAIGIGSMGFLALIAGVIVASDAPILLALLPLCVPITALASLAAWKPIDTSLKRKIFKRAAAIVAVRPDLVTIGIAGSVGKTTVKELLRHILANHALATPEHTNTELGVAEWIVRDVASHPEKKILIIEMGAYRKGEIALLCSFTKPTIGVLTVLGQDHLGLFGSEKSIHEANGELFEFLPPHGTAITTIDVEACAHLLNGLHCRTMTVSTGGPADIAAYDIEETPRGLSFTINDATVHVALFGTHNVTNVLLALAAARAAGMDLADAIRRLQGFVPPPLTFALQEERGVTILNDTHNASPQSFRAALAWARMRPEQTKVLLTSGILELGKGERAIHRELGAIAGDVFDRIIVVDDKVRSLLEESGTHVEVIGRKTPRIEAGALLVAVGRMRQSFIKNLLP
jgi:UDP-N-acetylmuramoyl-tripeptide--D-alanyl-D-alanine ligase